MDETDRLLNVRRAKYIKNYKKSLKLLVNPHIDRWIVVFFMIGTILIISLIVYKYNSLQNKTSNNTLV